MTYVEALQKIRDKKIPPVVLLYGTESFFIQHLKDELIKSELGDNFDSVSHYDLEEIPIEEVVTDAETFPFFDDKKLIIAHNPTFLLAKPTKLPFDHDLKRLEAYIENPVDYSTVVLIAPYQKIDKRKKVMKLLNKHALVVECNGIKEYEFSKWVKQLTSSLHVTIDDQAVDVLASELELNLQLVQSELKKMALYVGQDGTVTKEIAQALISRTENSSALRLVDAVIEKNLHKAISIYKDLEKNHEEPIALIALLAYQYRIIYRVKLLKQKGYSQSHIQNQLKVHPYVVKIAMDRINRFSESTLKHIIHALANTDASIKQGKMEKGLAFELLLYTLIQAAKKE